MNINSSYSPFLDNSSKFLPLTRDISIGHNKVVFFDSELQINRDLLIWYPLKNTESKKPVIIISHGYTGQPMNLNWMIDQLVQNGYIVIGTKHEDNNKEIDVNHWKRARDIQEIIKVFSNTPHSEDADLNHMGFVGFSLGATTGVWVSGARSTNLETLAPPIGWASESEFGRVNEGLDTLDKEKMNQNWKIPEIKAAFMIAPAWAWLFKKEELGKVSIPTYFTAGLLDSIVNSERNASYFAQHIPNASYDSIPNATHFTFIDQVSEESKSIQLKVAEKAIKFFNQSLIQST